MFFFDLAKIQINFVFSKFSKNFFFKKNHYRVIGVEPMSYVVSSNVYFYRYYYTLQMWKVIESNYHGWIFSPLHWPTLLTFLFLWLCKDTNKFRNFQIFKELFFYNFLLKRMDLNHRSHISDRLFIVVPICPHHY